MTSATTTPDSRSRRGPSMAQVAHLAGVSSQTVSRVANGLTNVDGATRDRVLAAMDELGYRPNSAARALKSGQFRTIGVILFTLSSTGNSRTLEAIATHAANSRPAAASAQRVTGESTNAVTHCGSSRPGLSGSKRGRRHAKATTAKVNVSAHAAPIKA